MYVFLKRKMPNKPYCKNWCLFTSVHLQDEDEAAGCFPPPVNHDTAEVHRPRIAAGLQSAISHFHNENQWAVNPCWHGYGARRAYGSDTETIKQLPSSGARYSVCVSVCVRMWTCKCMCVFVSGNKKQLHVLFRNKFPVWYLGTYCLKAVLFYLLLTKSHIALV